MIVTPLARQLASHLGLTVVAAAALMGCESKPDFDDEACMRIEVEESCPSPEQAEDQLVGQELCESPVREIKATGELVSDEIVEANYAYTIDTGTLEDVRECCYEATYIVHPDQSCAIGRPLRHNGRIHTATAASNHDWQEDSKPDLSGLSQQVRVEIAAFWRTSALVEHASVASFARFSLELMSHGAPAHLIEGAHRAALDEVRHARLGFSLASAFEGQSSGAGPMAMPTLASRPLREVVMDTLQEGCVGETLAVIVAAEQLRRCTDPAVGEVLQTIIRDETRHAELAWGTIRWALGIDGDGTMAAIRSVLEAGPPSFAGIPEEASMAALARGVLNRELSQRVIADGFERVVRPALLALGGSGQPSRGN